MTKPDPAVSRKIAKLARQLELAYRLGASVHEVADDINDGHDDLADEIVDAVAKHIRKVDPQIGALSSFELDLRLADLRNEIAHRLQDHAAGLARYLRNQVDVELEMLEERAVITSNNNNNKGP